MDVRMMIIMMRGLGKREARRRTRMQWRSQGLQDGSIGLSSSSSWPCVWWMVGLCGCAVCVKWKGWGGSRLGLLAMMMASSISAALPLHVPFALPCWLQTQQALRHAVGTFTTVACLSF